MKQGWEIKKLGDICSFERGLTYAKGDEVETSSKGVLRSNNVDLSTSTLNFDEIKYLREDFEIPRKKKVQKGSLLMCISNGSKIHLGKVALIEEDLDFAFGGFMGLLTPNETIVYPKYFYYALISPAYKFFINSLSDGANINNLKFADLKSFDIPIPSLEVQERIVEILDREFERIDALKANAEQNLQHAKDLFQSALKQELQPKEGWVTMKLGAFAHMKAGDFIKASDIKDEYFEGAYPCYGGNGLRGYVKEPNRNGEYCLIGRQGALCGNIHIANGVFRATEHAVVVSPYQKMPIKLIYYLLVSLNLNQYSTGAAQPGLSVKNIADNVSISVPPKDIWNSIALRLEVIESNCKALEENYRKTIVLCDDMKQALLRKAFNGEL
ncbi:MAG: restriction endonuclease subunit S [Alistipes sp.]|nr:restriction endonuclease subunit S [Alistipes sp.]